MPITLAGPLGNHPGMNGSPRYTAPTPQMAPQEKSAADMIKEQASSMAMEAGTKAAKEAGTEYIIDPLKTKAKEMWKGFTSPAPATAPASSFTSAPFASANIGPGGGMSGAFSPTVLTAELTGTMMSGTVPGTVASTVAPTAASTVAPAVASTVAPAVAGTVAPAVVGAGPLAAMMASPLAPLAIGALAGKAFGLFNKGGYVSGPLSAADGSMPVPISKRNAIAQAIEEDRIKAAERVRAAQQKAEYNKLLRDQEIVDRKVALDRQKADQAESRQGMILDSVLADIGYQNQYGNGMAEPSSKVEYKSAGGLFKMASPAAMLMDKNKKPEDLLKMVSPLAMLMDK